MTSRRVDIHHALYRRYRPETFKDVLGQDHVVKTLQNALALGNVFHAYLFAGSRGTGKTTLARIVAKEIGASEHDIYEIDAASQNGVDEVRALNEAVNILPLESPYKVYIFDEVHMFSKSAFNALLKTLEEPPTHVVFILATTEIDRVPETVLSRCQVFTLKKPSREVLKQSISAIAKKEGFTLEAGVADLAALLGDGSFRDAQGVVQKLMSASKDKRLTLAEAERVTGAPRGTLVNDFLQALSLGRADEALGIIGRTTKEQVDTKVFLALVLQKLRFALLLRYAKDMEKEISEEVAPDDLVFLKKCASDGKGVTPALLSELLTAYEATGRAYISSLPLELAVVRMAESPPSATSPANRRVGNN